MRFLATSVCLAALAAILGAGCGSSSGSGGSGGSGSGGTSGTLAADGAVPLVTTGRYQPLVVGTTWIYNVTDTGVAYTKNSAVESFEDIGGVAAGTMGYKVSETIKTSTQLTWYESTDTDVRRHHDQQTDANGVIHTSLGQRPRTASCRLPSGRKPRHRAFTPRRAAPRTPRPRCRLCPRAYAPAR